MQRVTAIDTIYMQVGCLSLSDKAIKSWSWSLIMIPPYTRPCASRSFLKKQDAGYTTPRLIIFLLGTSPL